MSNRFHRGWVMVALVSALAFAWACGDKAPEVKAPKAAKPKGPDYQVFAPLEKILTEVTMPMLVGTDELFPCFKAVGVLEPQEPDVMVKDMLENSQRQFFAIDLEDGMRGDATDGRIEPRTWDLEAAERASTLGKQFAVDECLKHLIFVIN